MLHAIEQAQTGTRTDFAKPFIHFQQFLRRRGIVVVISDFCEEPDVIIKTVEPLRFRGNELILFHVLDPQEIRPKLKEPVLLVDMETDDAWKFAGIRQGRIRRQDRRAHRSAQDEGQRRRTSTISCCPRTGRSTTRCANIS